MPPKKFEGKFGIPQSNSIDSELTSALYRLPDSISLPFIESMTEDIVSKVNKRLEEMYEESLLGNDKGIANVRIRRALSDEQRKILQLKLTRHFEDNGESAKIDVPVCVDALIESPRFLESMKGSMDKLFAMHEMKILQKIAELRRKRAEMSGDESLYNPYENLFETSSGKYCMARLLNMPHLEEESEYMDHCVGTSTSYVNKIKKGEVEILSFRDTSTNNPIATIEYDLKSKRLLQIKLMSDKLPKLSDSFSADLLEAIEKLETTTNDLGVPRVIEGSLAKDMKTLLSLQEKSKKQEVYTRDDLLFLYEISSPIQCFDSGRDPLIDELLRKRNRQEDIQLLCNCESQFIAFDFIDINEQTQVFCEDTGKKITFVDFRLEANQKKLPQLLELAQHIKESGSPARPDMSFEGGIVTIDISEEKLKDTKTVLQSYKEADSSSPSWVWDEWINAPYTKPKLPLETIILSYNKDTNTRESSDKIVSDMNRLGLRPATLEELIALGVIKPEFNKRSGSYLVELTKYSLDGGSYVPCVDWGGDERDLVGYEWGGRWIDRNRFVCVRK